MNLREAAKMALHALEDIFGREKVDVSAINALRAALAEADDMNLNCKSVQKRLATQWGYVKAEADEPVAWAYVNSDGECEEIEYGRYNEDDDSYITHLYTHPPRREPLTDEAIRELWSWASTHEAEKAATTQQHAFARAVERAHGIGE